MGKGMLATLLAGAMLAATTASVLAQSFPSKPIRMIVPFSPGGAVDVFGRAVGQKLQERLGQPVIVENKPGAGGNIGTEFVARSAPDGYTVLVTQDAISAAPWLYKSLPFDVMKDFAPIGIGAALPMAVVAANKLPVTSISELIAYGRANPGKLSYATPGIGTPHHMATEWFMHRTGIEMVHVAYKGSAGILPDLMSGEVQVVFGALNWAAPLVHAGKIRLIAVAEHQRLPQFKDVPTVNETLPEFEVKLWFGLMAPAGTPNAVVTLLSDEQRTIVNTPEVRERLAGMGFYSNPTSAAEMRQTMIADFERFGTVVKAARIQPQ